MKFRLFSLVAAFVLLTSTLAAQSVEGVAFNIGPSGIVCGVHWNYCPYVPIVLESPKGEVSGTLWYDTYGTANFIQFSSLLGTAHEVNGSIYTFAGTDASGAAYTVTIDPVITSYVSNRRVYYKWLPSSTISLSY